MRMPSPRDIRDSGARLPWLAITKPPLTPRLAWSREATITQLRGVTIPETLDHGTDTHSGRRRVRPFPAMIERRRSLGATRAQKGVRAERRIRVGASRLAAR